MADEVFIDTTQQVRYEGRIEYQLLQTQKRLDEANLHYYQWDFLPSLSAFAGYALNYLGGTWSQVYLRNYPSSFVGLQLSYPIFEGGRRIQEIDQASLELDRAEEDIISLENQIDAQYAQAMADYKSDLNSYLTAEQNLALAKDVYRTIQLQYRAGTKSYLEVISAETDLRTAEITQATALYQVLSSKLDVQKALGTVPYSLTRTSNQ
jgi:outer membrane protein TolC